MGRARVLTAALALVAVAGYVIAAGVARFPPFARHPVPVVPSSARLDRALVSQAQLDASLGSGWRPHSAHPSSELTATCSAALPKGSPPGTDTEYENTSHPAFVFSLLAAYRDGTAAASSLLSWQHWAQCGQGVAWAVTSVPDYCSGSTPAVASIGGTGGPLHDYLAVWSCSDVVCVDLLAVPAHSSFDKVGFLSAIVETSSKDVQRLLSG